MTYRELHNFTWGELSNITWEEAAMPMHELLKKLIAENRPLPIEMYEKLCKLCDEINSSDIFERAGEFDIAISAEAFDLTHDTPRIKKPNNFGGACLIVFLNLINIIKGVEYLQDKFSDLLDWFGGF